VDLCRIGYGSTAERNERRNILEDHFLRSRTVYLRYREAIIRTIEGLPAEAAVFAVEDQTRLGLICRALQSMDLKYVIMGKERLTAFPYTVDDDYTFTNIVGLRSRNDSVVYCMCSPREPTYEVPPALVRAGIEFFHRANFGLNVGGFEFDLDDNTFRFTGSVDVSQLGAGADADATIEALTINLIKLCMRTASTHYVLVMHLSGDSHSARRGGTVAQ
jgi:hypothetical protein